MKSDIFKTEINYIKKERYRKNAEALIEVLPDYFFKVPASSTGKYHPSFALGEGGLVRHTKVAVKMANVLLSSMVGDSFKEEEKDLMILALILHDGLKHGFTFEKYVKFEHPILIAEFIKQNKGVTDFSDNEIKFLQNVVSSHMGPFNTNNYSDVVLPIPKNKYQKFVHMCDFLASRKFLDVKFKDNEIEEE